MGAMLQAGLPWPQHPHRAHGPEQSTESPGAAWPWAQRLVSPGGGAHSQWDPLYLPARAAVCVSS